MSLRALMTAATGMTAQALNIDVIANNLANVNTTGFKRMRASFEDLLYQQIRPAGTIAAAESQVPSGIQVGLGTRVVATQRIFEEGSFQLTGRELDLAIAGGGFFQVVLADGSIAYTRAGSFNRDSDGRVVDPNGYPIEGDIIIPEDAIGVSVGLSGAVQVTIPGQVEPDTVGNIELARFVNPEGLRAIGDNLLVESAASGTATTGTPGQEGLGEIIDRTLEASIVVVVRELVDLITAQRAFEINSQVIRAADSMLERVTTLR